MQPSPTNARPLRSLRYLALLAALPISAPSASCQPALETGPRIVRVESGDSGLSMRDADSGKVLLDHRGSPLFDARSLPGALEPGVTVQIQPAGFDIVYTFRNAGSDPAPMASLRVGIFTPGPDAVFEDFRAARPPIPADPEDFPVRSFNYPGAIYSPAAVLRDGEHALGLSIQYPILEYRHDVRLTLRSPGGRMAKGAGGRGFEVLLALSSPRAGRDDPERSLRTIDSVEDDAARETRTLWPDRAGLVPPGQERTYIVSVRATRSPDEWVRTLLPYRDHFRRLYGGVTYKRQTGPINGIVMANIARVAPDNPYGWTAAAGRPDKAGFAPFVDKVKARKGWSAFMLWQPTGLYDRVAPPRYFPFQVATRWTADPALSSALDPQRGLSSIPAATGAQLGIWFNFSLEVAREWNSPKREPLSPDSRDLAAAAFAELDAAEAARVTLVGLDTFSPHVLPAWRLVPWLQRLRERYPRMTFATEPFTFDILHAIAPTYLRGYNDRARPESLEALYGIRGPHLLADFLLPGHEIWGAMRYGGYRWFDTPLTRDLIIEDARRFASWGFRPLLFTDFDLPDGIEAAESWKRSIPADLRLPAGEPN